MIGQTVSHYKILEKLGEGGMGVVYKAEDTRLKRTVALKFLTPRAVGTEEDKTRFLHEARAAAALNHNNICTVYEIDEVDGNSFLSMEFIEGGNLKDEIKIAPLTIGRALDIATQIAEGLQCAHAREIIHRDIKAANIMVTAGGQAKIMDFGLAKSPGQEQLTREGTTVGTVAYMSPEQGRGDVVDARSDIWSLGVVLYEMVSGRLPFKGDHEQAVMYSVLHEEPVVLTGLRSDVPTELERIVGKCLEKDPSRRYQSVGDLLVDLKRVLRDLVKSHQSVKTGTTVKKRVRRLVLGVSVAALLVVSYFLLIYPRFFGSGPEAPEAGMKKLAVLFFANLGPPDDEYFADGITDAITARLAVIHGLGVISRQSTIQFKNSEKSIHDIGKELGVDYVLEGTIQREKPGDPASRVRIIPQLINVSDDIHLWADTYDEDMTEVFRVQSRIAERVAKALDVTLLATEREVLDAAPTENLEAYEYYLRGNDYMSKRYSSAISRKTVEMFEKATELDPGFAAAWAGLSQAYIWLFYSRNDPRPDRKRASKSAVDKANELDPDSPEVQLAFGYYYYYGEHDFNRALDYFESARSRRPNDVEVLNAIAYIKRRQGRWDECALSLERAAELNPLAFDSVVELGVTYVSMRRYDEAERLFDRGIFLFPEDPVAHFYKILLVLLRDGDVEKAKEATVAASKFVEPAQLGIDVEPFVCTRIMAETYADLLSRTTPEAYGIVDTTLFHFGLAEMYLELGMGDKARELWQIELVHLKKVKNPLFQYDVDLCRGLAYAGLGRTEDALRIARDVLAGSPLSEDALLGAFRLELAALILLRTGAYEEAIDQLELLLSVPSETSRTLYRLDPAWEPIHDNPRFLKLVEGEP